MKDEKIGTLFLSRKSDIEADFALVMDDVEHQGIVTCLYDVYIEWTLGKYSEYEFEERLKDLAGEVAPFKNNRIFKVIKTKDNKIKFKRFYKFDPNKV